MTASIKQRKNPWHEYERRKAQVKQQRLSPDQFLAAMKQIIKDLGI